MDNSDSNMPEKDTNKKGHILFVDDDRMFLKLMKKIFENHYFVTTAESGEEALSKIEEGCSPTVIISDQMMPGISGTEFLEESMKYSPNSIRILLTGQSNPTKEIIKFINKAIAFLYLTKPIEQLQIVMTVKIAIEQYNSKLNFTNQITNLIKKIEKLKKEYSELEKTSAIRKLPIFHTIQLIAGLHNNSNKLFFENQTKYISSISISIGEILGLENDSMLELALASQLYCFISASLPSKYILNDPYNIEDEKERIKYFELFLNAQIPFFGNTFCINSISIVSQLWEHYDGSGMPLHLTATQFSKEANIISLANFYFNNVYRLTPEQFSSLKKEGNVYQDGDSTFQRHNDTIKILNKRTTWFDYDVFQSFMELIKKRSCPELIPSSENLIINIFDFLPPENNVDSKLTETDTPLDENLDSSVENNNSDEENIPAMEEIIIHISDIEDGMLIKDSVITKKGVLVVKPETTVDPIVIKKLKTLESSGNFDGYVKVMLPNNHSLTHKTNN
jgi:response regulator RpfG family c-di-GMP phosphodiesterase